MVYTHEERKSKVKHAKNDIKYIHIHKYVYI
jgi:hypothetical protein